MEQRAQLQVEGNRDMKSVMYTCVKNGLSNLTKVKNGWD